MEPIINIFGERTGFLYNKVVGGDESCKFRVSAMVSGIDMTGEDKSGVQRLFVEHVWPASIALADYLCENTAIVTGKTVVELGAGCALPSVVASQLGAAFTVATDYPDPRVLDNIRTILERNHCNSAVVVGHSWGSSVEPIVAALSEAASRTIDVVLLADVLWKDTYHLHRSLLQSVSSLLQEGGIALLAGAHRPTTDHKKEYDLELLELAKSEFGLASRLVSSYPQHHDAMDGEPIEVFLYELKIESSISA